MTLKSDFCKLIFSTDCNIFKNNLILSEKNIYSLKETTIQVADHVHRCQLFYPWAKQYKRYPQINIYLCVDKMSFEAYIAYNDFRTRA